MNEEDLIQAKKEYEILNGKISDEKWNLLVKRELQKKEKFDEIDNLMKKRIKTIWTIAYFFMVIFISLTVEMNGHLIFFGGTGLYIFIKVIFKIIKKVNSSDAGSEN